jgi:addiction module HigA family antidote
VRLVADTNILISALLVGTSLPAHLVALWCEGRFELLTSAEQVDELMRVTQCGLSWRVTMEIRTEDVAGMNFADVTGNTRIGAVTPGEVLREEFMLPHGLSARALARELGVPSNRITAILAGDRGVTAETAILLGERFGTSAEFWLNLQLMHALEEARRHTPRRAA